MQRFFTAHKLHEKQTLTLEPAIAKHAIKVLRHEVGDVIELADPEHHVYHATIQSTDLLTVLIGEDVTQPVELPIAVEIV
ncbi:MAG TPA: 16S rRNA methyltransferase, partial [Lactobacillus sp.]|nr:16S rRNA methyltransferase [Lactobacillus sp.]